MLTAGAYTRRVYWAVSFLGIDATMRKLYQYAGQYKVYALLAPLAITGEVILEVLIPMLMAGIDKGIVMEAFPTPCARAWQWGMALASLGLGAMAGACGRGGMGFAKTCGRRCLTRYRTSPSRIRTSSPPPGHSPPTTNVQNAFLMTLRPAVRAPDADRGGDGLSVTKFWSYDILMFAHPGGASPDPDPPIPLKYGKRYDGLRRKTSSRSGW